MMNNAALLCLLLVPLALAAILPAGADEGCVVTPTGIDCSAAGSSTSAGTAPGAADPGLPLRYLATAENPDADGLCWFWSPIPPGLDSWNPMNDQAILLTLWALPECPTPEAPGETLSTNWVVARACEAVTAVVALVKSLNVLAPKDLRDVGNVMISKTVISSII